MRNPTQGGRYIKATADSESIFVSGTDREQTPAEKKKADKILNKKPSASAEPDPAAD